MRVAAQVDVVAAEDVGDVGGMQRLDLRVRRFGDVDIVVALNGLVQKRKSQQQRKAEDQPEAAAGIPARYAGFHRSTGLRAAVTSSTRLVRVL